jgi:formamidopyrimidine-DNA glycosylase
MTSPAMVEEIDMPELPEVETVRRGLEPLLTGARIEKVTLRRADLRVPFPEGFAEGLTGQTIVRLTRRAKYLLAELSGGKTWLTHLGMTGSFGFREAVIAEPTRYHLVESAGAHEHVEMTLRHPRQGPVHLFFTDARRFGVMDLLDDAEHSDYLKDLGPEPLGNAFSADLLAERFAARKAPIKAGLLDQGVVAGLGNIYVSEALHRAHIHPASACGGLVTKAGAPRAALELLAHAVRQVLTEAIEVGGSTLRDFRNADGQSGYFQHRFAVYDRAGEPCPTPLCTGTVERLVQSGRSSFFCPVCQKLYKA